MDAANARRSKHLTPLFFTDLACLDTSDRVADQLRRDETVAAHRREFPGVRRRQTVRPSVDAQRQVDHVGIDADLRRDLSDPVDDSADHNMCFLLTQAF